jgi:hypothetical protein
MMASRNISKVRVRASVFHYQRRTEIDATCVIVSDKLAETRRPRLPLLRHDSENNTHDRSMHLMAALLLCFALIPAAAGRRLVEQSTAEQGAGHAAVRYAY